MSSERLQSCIAAATFGVAESRSYLRNHASTRSSCATDGTMSGTVRASPQPSRIASANAVRTSGDMVSLGVATHDPSTSADPLRPGGRERDEHRHRVDPADARDGVHPGGVEHHARVGRVDLERPYSRRAVDMPDPRLSYIATRPISPSRSRNRANSGSSQITSRCETHPATARSCEGHPRTPGTRGRHRRSGRSGSRASDSRTHSSARAPS